MHKDLELQALMKDIATLEEGVQEYQDRIDLLEEKKLDIQKSMVRDEEWCGRFRVLIGPFEAKYEECKAEVKVSFDHAKTKYHESLQKLIDDFGFHPAFKRYATHSASNLQHSSRPHARCFFLAGGSMNFKSMCSTDHGMALLQRHFCNREADQGSCHLYDDCID